MKPLPFFSLIRSYTLATLYLCSSAVIAQSNAAAPYSIVLEGSFPVHQANIGRFNAALASVDDQIYLAYIGPQLRTQLAHKQDGVWREYTLEQKTHEDPYHTQPSLAVDGESRLHVVYNMHSSPWQYQMSDSAHDPATLTFYGQDGGRRPGYATPRESDCSGDCYQGWISKGSAAIPGNQITYPFMRTDRGGNVFIGYRECLNCDSSDYFSRQWSGGLARFPAAGDKWSRVGENSLFATDPDYVPLGLHFNFDAQNRMHVAWVWGRHYTAGSQGSAFHSSPNYPSYAWSDDGGKTFHSLSGRQLALPLSADFSEAVVSPGWIRNPERGYFFGYTQIAINPDNEPLVVVFPRSTQKGAVHRAFVHGKKGEGWQKPVLLPWAASHLQYDNRGQLLALSSGLRLHISTDHGKSWQTDVIDNDGPYTVFLDYAFGDTGQGIRFAAMQNRRQKPVMKIWTLYTGKPVTTQSLVRPQPPENVSARTVAK